MANANPIVVVLAGPNGAGKSTAAPAVLRETLSVTEFVNADDIARGLSAFAPERVAVDAGRIMLKRVHALADERADFAFETTLASRSFAPWIAGLRRTGYVFRMTYVWTNDPELSSRRVAESPSRRAGPRRRASRAGRRSSTAMVAERQQLFSPLQTHRDVWTFYNNSDPENLQKVAAGGTDRTTDVLVKSTWDKLLAEHDTNEHD